MSKRRSLSKRNTEKDISSSSLTLHNLDLLMRQEHRALQQLGKIRNNSFYNEFYSHMKSVKATPQTSPLTQRTKYGRRVGELAFFVPKRIQYLAPTSNTLPFFRLDKTAIASDVRKNVSSTSVKGKIITERRTSSSIPSRDRRCNYSLRVDGQTSPCVEKIQSRRCYEDVSKPARTYWSAENSIQETNFVSCDKKRDNFAFGISIQRPDIRKRNSCMGKIQSRSHSENVCNLARPYLSAENPREETIFTPCDEERDNFAVGISIQQPDIRKRNLYVGKIQSRSHSKNRPYLNAEHPREEPIFTPCYEGRDDLTAGSSIQQPVKRKIEVYLPVSSLTPD